MKAKFVNEQNIRDILKPKKLSPKLKKQWEEGGNFREIAKKFEEEFEKLNIDEGFENYDIDYTLKIISFNHSWSDDEYECDVVVDIDFKTGEIRYKGSCTNEDIEVPGPGYMVPFSYYNQQTDTFDRNISFENFIAMLNDEVEGWFGNFSYFAQKEGDEEANTEYCPSCGSPEDECEKCEDCGECMNDCECEEDEDDEED